MRELVARGGFEALRCGRGPGHGGKLPNPRRAASAFFVAGALRLARSNGGESLRARDYRLRSSIRGVPMAAVLSPGMVDLEDNLKSAFCKKPESILDRSPEAGDLRRKQLAREFGRRKRDDLHGSHCAFLIYDCERLNDRAFLYFLPRLLRAVREEGASALELCHRIEAIQLQLDDMRWTLLDSALDWLLARVRGV